MPDIAVLGSIFVRIVVRSLQTLDPPYYCISTVILLEYSGAMTQKCLVLRLQSFSTHSSEVRHLKKE